MYTMEKREPALMVMSASTFLIARYRAQSVGCMLISDESEPPYYEVDLEIGISLPANIVKVRCSAPAARRLKRRKLHTFKLSHHSQGIVFEAVTLKGEYAWRTLYA